MLEEIRRLRGLFYDISLDLWAAANAEELEDADSAIQTAKKRVREVMMTASFVPRGHRKAYWCIRNVILQLSAVPSKRVGLCALSRDEHLLIHKVLVASLGPKLDYAIDVAGHLNELEARGFCTTPRIGL